MAHQELSLADQYRKLKVLKFLCKIKTENKKYKNFCNLVNLYSFDMEYGLGWTCSL